MSKFENQELNLQHIKTKNLCGAIQHSPYVVRIRKVAQLTAGQENTTMTIETSTKNSALVDISISEYIFDMGTIMLTTEFYLVLF